MNLLKFKCSASCGDMIYSLIFVKHICEQAGARAVYYIENDNRFAKARKLDTLQACKRLIEYQQYVESCEKWQGQAVDYDLDLFRKQVAVFHDHPLPTRFFNAFKVPLPTKYEPWLTAPIGSFMPAYLLNHTLTYNSHNVDFVKAINRIVGADYTVSFVGTKEEAERYLFPRLVTDDLLDVARYIASCRALFCNQSACLTIAQGLGKQVYLAKDVKYNNTILGLETILC